MRAALIQLLMTGTLGPENDAAAADLVASAADRRLRALEKEGTTAAMAAAVESAIEGGGSSMGSSCCRAQCVALAFALRRLEAAALRRLRIEAGALFGLV